MSCVNSKFVGYEMEVLHCRQNPYRLFETILCNTLQKYFNYVSW